MATISDEVLEAAVKPAQPQPSGVSPFLFNVLRECCERTDTLDEAAAVFVVATKKAEAQLKRMRGVSNLKSALPHWCVNKSEMLKALQLGIDPRNYTSGSALRSTVQRVRKAVTRQGEPFDDIFGDIS